MKKHTYRWREGGRHRSKTFTRKQDYDTFKREVERAREMGGLTHLIPKSCPTLQAFFEEWFATRVPDLSPNTMKLYAYLWKVHLSPQLGGYRLNELRPMLLAEWQAERIRDGAGQRILRQAGGLLSRILKRAYAMELIPGNPCDALEWNQPQRKGIVILPPARVEEIRQSMIESKRPAYATLVSVLAYSGLRSYSEALALHWEQIGEGRILVDRKLIHGEIHPGTKTGKLRSVTLLSPLAQDLNEWRLAQGRPSGLVFPRTDGKPWAKTDYNNWRRRWFTPLAGTRPYDLRHSFASLLINEGLPITEVAQEMGHSPAMCLSVYAHVQEAVKNRVPAEEAIRAARQSNEGRRVA